MVESSCSSSNSSRHVGAFAGYVTCVVVSFQCIAHKASSEAFGNMFTAVFWGFEYFKGPKKCRIICHLFVGGLWVSLRLSNRDAQ